MQIPYSYIIVSQVIIGFPIGLCLLFKTDRKIYGKHLTLSVFVLLCFLINLHNKHKSFCSAKYNLT